MQIRDLLEFRSRPSPVSLSCHGVVSMFDALGVQHFRVASQSAWRMHEQVSSSCHGAFPTPHQVSNDLLKLSQMGVISPTSCYGSIATGQHVQNDMAVLNQMGVTPSASCLMPSRTDLPTSLSALGQARNLSSLSSLKIGNWSSPQQREWLHRHPTSHLPDFCFAKKETMMSMAASFSKLAPVALEQHYLKHKQAVEDRLTRAVLARIDRSTPVVLVSATAASLTPA